MHFRTEVWQLLRSSTQMRAQSLVANCNVITNLESMVPVSRSRSIGSYNLCISEFPSSIGSGMVVSKVLGGLIAMNRRIN